MDLSASPFAALSLIVAPAMLTNASSLLAMSTSNRLARAVDRARDLSRQLEEATEFTSAEAARRLAELTAAETRALLLLRALRNFYLALGAFASATLISLLGAISIPIGTAFISWIFEIVAGIAGVVAVGSLVTGSVLLLRETSIAVRVLSERAQCVRDRASARGGTAHPGPEQSLAHAGD